MISNYFTLLHATRELHSLCSGFKIIEAYSQEKDTLCLVVYTGDVLTIKISCQSSSNYLLCRKGNFRAKNNSLDLFPELMGKRIEQIAMHPHDRILQIELEDTSFIKIDMFRGKANILYCDAQGKILDAFMYKKELLENHCEKFSQKSPPISLPSDVDWLKLSVGTETISKLLKKTFPVFNEILVSEILFRNGIQKTVFGSELSSANRQRLYDTAKELFSSLTAFTVLSPRVYLDENSPVCFSLIPLKQFTSLEEKTFQSLFEAIQFTVSRTKSSQAFLEKKKEIVSWLTKEEAKATQTLSKIEEELQQSFRAEEYERYGKLIMSSLHSLHKGMKSITLQNIFAANENVTIALQPALSPQQNAERYFEKAKKAKISMEEQHSRKTMLQHRLHNIFVVLEDFNTAEESISLKNSLQLHQEQLRMLGYKTEREQENLPPFKIFTVDGGFTVFAGKNSENNDLLTMKHAKSNDLWFHSRGSSGSHVVLKIGSANGTPSKKAIEQAASIAAYYSKMKNAKNVPVAMTEKKFVHKPKGAKPGSVVIEREKVLFVEPRLPENAHDKER